MGISTNSKVAFICAADESAWAEQFLKPLNTPSKHSSGHETLSVNGAGFWDAAKENVSVPVCACTVSDNGTVVTIASGYYGLINPARMDLPTSLQAVVYASESCQSEPQDPIYAVLAKDVHSHNFSDESEVNKPAWFDYDRRSSQAYEYAEAASYDDEKDEELFDLDKVWEQMIEALRSERTNAFPALIKHVQALPNLDAPFVDHPELATVMGFLKAIDHEESDEEYGYSWDDVPEYPRWDYSNIEIIFSKEEPKFSKELQEILDQGADICTKAEAARQERLKQYAPTKTGLSREEYASAFRTALDGGEDVTGIMKAIESLNLGSSPIALGKLRGYTLERIERPTSKAGNALIAATTGEEVYRLINGLFQKGNYNNFQTQEEREQAEAAAAAEPEESIEETFDAALGEAYFEKIFAEAAKYKSLILANIDEIASNFTEDNPYSANGSEPEWLLDALLKTGMEFG